MRLTGVTASRRLCAADCSGCGALPSSQRIAVASLGAARSRRYGVQRGTEVEVTFNGGRLADAQEILLLLARHHGHRARRRDDDNRSRRRSTIAPDCRLGEHALPRPHRDRHQRAAHVLRRRAAGRRREVSRTATSPRRRRSRSTRTVNGVVDNEDVDYFVVEAKKGQRHHRRDRRAAAGHTRSSIPTSPSSTQALRAGHAATTRPCCSRTASRSIVAPEDGKYIVQVRETLLRRQRRLPLSPARRHVSRGRRPSFPPAASRAKTLEVQVARRLPAASSRRRSRCRPSAANEFELFAKDDGGIAPSANVVPRDRPGQRRSKPSRTTPSPQATAGDGAAAPSTASSSKPGDVDYFKFTAKKGQVFDVRVLRPQRFARRSIRCSTSTTLSGGGIAGNDDTRRARQLLRASPRPTTASTCVSVHDHLQQRRARLRLSRRGHAGEAGADDGVCPSGSSMCRTTRRRAARATAWPSWSARPRPNFGGDLNVEFKDLPPGVTLETVPMAANLSDVPVVFTAAADAALGRLAGRRRRQAASIANMKIEGHLRPAHDAGPRPEQHRRLGARRRPHGRRAVTEEVPVHDRHRRAQGAAGPQRLDEAEGRRQARAKASRRRSRVRLLYNPPGVGSSGIDRRFPKARTKRSIPLNANGGAEISKWKIVVMGRCDASATGPVAVSSQLADLEIADAVLRASRSTRRPSSRARRPTSSIKVDEATRLRRDRQGRAARPARRT